MHVVGVVLWFVASLRVTSDHSSAPQSRQQFRLCALPPPASLSARRVDRLQKKGIPATNHQEALSAFLESVWCGEQGPDSSVPFNDLDEMLDGLAALGEDLPDIDDPTSFCAAMLI